MAAFTFFREKWSLFVLWSCLPCQPALQTYITASITDICISTWVRAFIRRHHQTANNKLFKKKYYKDVSHLRNLTSPTYGTSISCISDIPLHRTCHMLWIMSSFLHVWIDLSYDRPSKDDNLSWLSSMIKHIFPFYSLFLSNCIIMTRDEVDQKSILGTMGHSQ